MVFQPLRDVATVLLRVWQAFVPFVFDVYLDNRPVEAMIVMCFIDLMMKADSKLECRTFPRFQAESL